MSALLEVRGVSKSYRGVVAVKDADLTLQPGTIHGVIGPNGAGKTTLLNIISGYVIPDGGRVAHRGVDITRLAPRRRAHAGFTRTFQDCRLLEDLTVADNLWLGLASGRRLEPGAPAAERAYWLLEQVGLQGRLDVAVRDLPSGARKAVEVARALMAGGSLLLLDEPFSGLTSREVDLMLSLLRDLRTAGTCSMLLIEHNLGAVFDLCDDVTAMDRAAVVVAGSAATVRDDDRVRAAFFGGDAEASPEPAVAPAPASAGSEAGTTGAVGLMANTETADTGAPDAAGTTDGAKAPILAVHDLHAGYRRTRILHGIEMEIGRGHIVGLIGANGAGKTTLFRSIMGLATIHSGSIEVDGARLRRRTDAIVAAGVSYCPQGRNLFPSLTVEENLRLGGRAVRRRAGSAGGSGRSVDEVLDLLPGISPFRRKAAGSLSGGQQQLVAIGRALMSSPRVLLLDEPSSGLAVGAIQVIGEALRELSTTGLAVILAEQNLPFAIALCERGYVIESGRIAAEGSHEVLARAWELTVAEGHEPAATTLAVDEIEKAEPVAGGGH